MHFVMVQWAHDHNEKSCDSSSCGHRIATDRTNQRLADQCESAAPFTAHLKWLFRLWIESIRWFDHRTFFNSRTYVFWDLFSGWLHTQMPCFYFIFFCWPSETNNNSNEMSTLADDDEERPKTFDGKIIWLRMLNATRRRKAKTILCWQRFYAFLLLFSLRVYFCLWSFALDCFSANANTFAEAKLICFNKRPFSGELYSNDGERKKKNRWQCNSRWFFCVTRDGKSREKQKRTSEWK